MNSIKIYDKDFYYIDSNDPVISALKNHQLFGINNYLLLKRFSLDATGWIIDCGAHIGTFSFLPAIQEQNQILLIEGADQNYECLKLTFKNFANTILENAIILDKQQNCNFSTDYGPFGSPDISSDGKKQSETIDNLCKKHNIDKVSMIKLDIEGFEQEALIGAEHIIQSTKPVILLEINGHCLRMRNKKPQEVLQTIQDIGYLSFIHHGSELIPVETNKKFPFCVMDVLCIHKDNISKYIGISKFLDYLPDTEINKILEQNYINSNEDCQKYFQSLI